VPIYLYQNQTTGEVVEIIQGMNDEHVYHGANGTENDWKRVYTSPQMSIDTRVDPNDPKAFVEATRSKKGTVGDMMDYSKELSEKRAEKAGGTDPVKQAFFDKYSKERKGAKHPEELKSQKLKNKNFTVDWD